MEEKAHRNDPRVCNIVDNKAIFIHQVNEHNDLGSEGHWDFVASVKYSALQDSIKDWVISDLAGQWTRYQM